MQLEKQKLASAQEAAAAQAAAAAEQLASAAAERARLSEEVHRLAQPYLCNAACFCIISASGMHADMQIQLLYPTG